MPRLIAAALLTLSLAACDTGGSDSNMAVYYVSGVRYTGATTAAAATSRIAIEYVSPDGVKRDTISGALVTWSKMFDRDALAEFRLKATNLSARDTFKRPNFVAASLLLDGKAVAADSSRTTVEVKQ